MDVCHLLGGDVNLLQFALGFCCLQPLLLRHTHKTQHGGIVSDKGQGEDEEEGGGEATALFKAKQEDLNHLQIPKMSGRDGSFYRVGCFLFTVDSIEQRLFPVIFRPPPLYLSIICLII